MFTKQNRWRDGVLEALVSVGLRVAKGNVHKSNTDSPNFLKLGFNITLKTAKVILSPFS